ncbi:Ribose operon repressor [Clostridium perfringens]|nr:substrate-binding domain-containing protein [Clostridium perfringens]MDH5076336.1 Ribose operon repressor [Clostridium perfringens]
MKNRPSAIFVCNNLMTLGCLKALREANLELSKDISLISFDNIPILDTLGINLSHINGPTRELGEIGMNLLIESLNNDSKKELNSIIITPELVLKGSEKLIK